MNALAFGAALPCGRCKTAGYLTPPKTGDPSTAGDPPPAHDRGRIRDLLYAMLAITHEHPEQLEVVRASGVHVTYVRCPACRGRGFR